MGGRGSCRVFSVDLARREPRTGMMKIQARRASKGHGASPRLRVGLAFEIKIIGERTISSAQPRTPATKPPITSP